MCMCYAFCEFAYIKMFLITIIKSIIILQHYRVRCVLCGIDNTYS